MGYSRFMKEKPSNSSWSRFMMTSWSGGVRTGGWRVKKRSKFSASRPHCRRERRTREACDGCGVMNMIIKTEESKRTEHHREQIKLCQWMWMPWMWIFNNFGYVMVYRLFQNLLFSWCFLGRCSQYSERLDSPSISIDFSIQIGYHITLISKKTHGTNKFWVKFIITVVEQNQFGELLMYEGMCKTQDIHNDTWICFWLC